MKPAAACLLLLCAAHSALSYKFLGFAPAMGRSHVNFLGKIADSLVDAGHEVTLLIPLIDTSFSPTSSKKAKLIFVPQCAIASELIKEKDKPGGFVDNSWVAKNPLLTMLSFRDKFGMFGAQCKATLDHPGLLEELNATKFDVGFTETVDLCGVAVFKHLGIENFVVTQSLPNVDGLFALTHVPSFPSYVPGPMGFSGIEMSFFERLNNIFSTYLTNYLFTTLLNTGLDEMLQSKFGADFPVAESILNNASLIFLNSEPLIDFPKPTAHRIVDIGGIVVHTGHAALNKTWSDILNRRKHNIIISFGTIAKSYLMPASYKNALRNVIRRFPDVTFIWKYEQPSDKISAGFENIVESTWLPQNDLLYDTRVKAFITHCGVGSTMESVIAGKPLIVIPVFGDQQRNAEMVRRIKTGIVLQKEDLQVENTIEEAIRNILGDASYIENAKRVAKMIADRPFKMKDVFVRNMEFVAKYGPLRMLDHYGAQLNFFQYYLIDVFAFLAAIVATVLFITYKLSSKESISARILHDALSLNAAMKAAVVCFVLLCSQLSAPYKFLGYAPSMGRSHVNFLGKIADSLVDAGHEVTLLIPLFDTSHEPTSSKKAKLVFVPQCEMAREVIGEVEKPGGVVDNVWLGQNLILTMFAFRDKFGAFSAQCKATIEHPGLLQKLKDEKFDVGFTETLDFCGAGIFKYIGLDKFVVTQSLPNLDGSFSITHVPSFPSYVPGPMGFTGEKMTISERLKNVIATYLTNYVFSLFNTGLDEIFRAKFGSDFPPAHTVMDNASLIFANSEPLIDFPKPTAHRIVDIGGIVVHSGHTALNKTWSDILSLRKHTVLLSFGTVAKSYLMPAQYKQTFRNVFKKFHDVTFVWKYERPEDGISGGIENIVESTWLPQSDMLHDKRLSAFITHCGVGSTMESTTAGKPLIVIPVAGDQLRNAEMVRRIKTGIVLEKADLEVEEKLETAIRSILSDSSYKENAKRVAQMIADRPFKVKDIFIRNIEFVAKYGPLRMLDHYGAQLNFIQYYLIDIFAFVAVVVFSVLYIVYKALRLIISCIAISRKTKKE